jgi:hypothetical protein
MAGLVPAVSMRRAQRINKTLGVARAPLSEITGISPVMMSVAGYFALRYRTSILAPVGRGLTLVSRSSSPDRVIPLLKR